MIEFYKNGNVFGIKTDANAHGNFVDNFSMLIEGLIDNGVFDGDWGFQIVGLVHCYIEIGNRLHPTDRQRRLNANVSVCQNIISTGGTDPEDIIARYSDKGGIEILFDPDVIVDETKLIPSFAFAPLWIGLS